MKHPRVFLIVLCIVALSLRAGAEAKIDFVKEIRPIFQSACDSCHGSQKQKGGLRLDIRDLALQGGDDGIAIIPHHPKESPLLRYVANPDPEQRMPPRGDALTPMQVTTLSRWIEQGADWPDDAPSATVSDPRNHWSFKPIARSPVPSVVDEPNWVRTPVDAFILTTLRQKKMSPAPVADRRTLLRRVTFDLTGLPPTPQELRAFVDDDSPNAYEKVVDRLLASPRYGERWARHWMDLVHFAESHGDDQDRERPNAWPYRDYLIRSFNADKPFARFIEDQVAGDALFPDDPDGPVAMGFIAAGPWDESSQMSIMEDTVDKKIARNLDRDDMVCTVMTTFTSTTVQCARCHNHKFDPISQQDYYGLQAVFAGVDRAERVYDRDPRTTIRRAQLQFEKQYVEAVGDGTSLRSDLLTVQRIQEIDRELFSLPAPMCVYTATHDFKPLDQFTPTPTPRPIFILKRGEVTQPVELATPGALSCLPGVPGQFVNPNSTDESLRRAALARWLADPHNCLTWRSIVNRVWQYRFGRGLVATPNDFGHMGTLPTHPELLDWLATWFLDHGGSIKQLDRLLVTSGVYRQSTQFNDAYSEIDSENRYLWRMNRMRLDAEGVRDSILQISGLLDTTMGGPSARQFIFKKGVQVTPALDYANFDPDSAAMRRLSVYRFLWRTVPDPFMDALDYPDGAQLTAERSVSITPVQALAMLNDRFVIRYSEHLAERLDRERSDLPSQIVLLYALCYSRDPTAAEMKAVSKYAGEYGLSNACRMILNSNEFMFVN